MSLCQLWRGVRICRRCGRFRCTCTPCCVNDQLLLVVKAGARVAYLLSLCCFVADVVDFLVLFYLSLLVFRQIVIIMFEDVLPVIGHILAVPRRTLLLHGLALSSLLQGDFLCPLELS